MSNGFHNKNSPLVIIGCGQHTQKTLLPTLSFLGLAPRLFVDLEIDRACKLATQFVGAAACDSLRDVADGDKVIVAAGPEANMQVLRELRNRAVTILLEKPHFPRGIRDYNDLLNVTNESTLVRCALNYRFAPAFVRFKQDLGPDPAVINLDFFSKKPLSVEFGYKSIHESWLFANGIHAVDLARQIAPTCMVQSAWKQMLNENEFCFTVVLVENLRIIVIKMGNCTNSFQLSINSIQSGGRRISMDSLKLATKRGGEHGVSGGTSDPAPVDEPRTPDQRFFLRGFEHQLNLFMKEPYKLPSPEDAFSTKTLLEQIANICLE